LNTPESLGTSLSVIGALILGQFSIDSGWFIPQTILVMAVVALASFTQPSIELSYGIKFIRVIMLVGSMLFGFWGLGGGLVIGFIIVAATKTVSGHSYLYPLIPFHWASLKKLLFRTSK
ncbi:MAG: spore germination protein, partial [Emergencia timonensis]